MAKKYLVWTDLLRIYSTLLVILLHCCLAIDYKIDPHNWWISNLYNSLSRPCITLFVMLSGTFLLNKTDDLNTFFYKRIKKVVIPLFAWSIVYLIFFHFHEGKEITAGVLIRSVISPSISYHLWFLFMILGIYLMVPIISKLVRIASRRDLEYFLILWFAITSIKPFIGELLGLYIYLPVEAATGYLGCFVLGYYLKDYSTPRMYLVYVFFVVSLCITAAGTFYLNIIKNHANLNDLFYGFLAPNVIIMSVSTYLIFRNLNFSQLNNKALKIIMAVSNLCFGIYLIHIIILIIIKDYFDFTFIPLIKVPVVVLICFSISLILTFMIRRIPVLNKATP